MSHQLTGVLAALALVVLEVVCLVEHDGRFALEVEGRELLERGAGWSRRPGSTRSVMAVIDAAPTGAERFRVVSVALERTAPPPKEAPAEEDPGA